MRLAIILSLLFFGKLFSQVNITTGTYSQNFGTANIGAWTNNVTFLGWYKNGSTDRGFADFTLAVNGFNAGGFYTYNCGSDAAIGSRASGSAPNNNIQYGLVLRNTTGLTISSLRVSYKGYQMSLAQNGNNINTIAFDYIVGVAPPAIGAGGGTSVAALNFTQLVNSAIAGGNQINWFPCTQSQAITACIATTILNNSYILLRWTDIDDGSNDHHMAIDNVDVAFDLTGSSCLLFLPIELLDFYGTKNKSQNDITWKVAQEENILYYILEKSNNGVDFTTLTTANASNEVQTKTYTAIDDSPYNDITYYRLKTKESNGSIITHKIISVDENSKDLSYTHYQQANNLVLEFKNTIPKNTSVEIFDLSGKQLISSTINQTQTIINTEDLASGIYFVRLSTAYKTEHFKIIISK